MYRVILFAALSAFSITLALGQYFETQTHRCYNPNERPGACVSIYDCQTLMSVVQRTSIQPLDREFLRASECFGGYGSGPYVCCTGDTGFTRTTYNDYDRPPSTVLLPADSIYGDQILPPRQPQPQWPIPPQVQRLNAVNGGGREFNSNGRAGGKQQRDIPSSNRVLVTESVSLPRAPTCGGVTISNKIYNGIDTDLYEFPWLALLEYNRASGGLSTNCAGSLISNRYVLTAAHCVKGKIEKEIGALTGVRLGEYDTTKQIDCIQNSCAPAAIRVGIEEKIPHELYNDHSANKANDIALLRLDRAIHFSDSIRPICLPSAVKRELSNPPSGTLYTVAGWGTTLRSPKSAIKQKLQVPLVDFQQCQRKYRELKVNILDSQICAGGIYAEDSCSGDSGGPMMRFRNNAWVLEGIISFGYKCGLRDWPAVHTRVANYDEWIRSKLRK